MSSSRTINSLLQKVLALILLFTMSSCGLSLPTVTWPTATPDVLDVTTQNTLESLGIITANSSADCPDYSPINGSANTGYNPDTKVCYYTLTTSGTQTVAGSSMSNLGSFTPVWNNLDPKCKSVEQVLEDHGLTMEMVIVHPVRKVSWESCLVVFEFKEQYRGSIVKLDVLGYADTIALVDDDVTQFFSGDPNVKQVASQWGFSARWGRSYQETAEGRWLNPNNSCEWNVREYRFGRYWRLPNIGLPDVPYYTRVGPYMTMPGNTNCAGWVPPALDEIVPQDYLQATAMLGGLAIESQWKHSPDKANWAWKYSGDGTFKWQTVYMPQASYGYVELWVNGGPKKFYATDLAELMLDNLNVEEFSYHSNPNK